MNHRFAQALTLLLTVALGVTSASCRREEPKHAAGPYEESAREEELTIFAAASLRETFTSLRAEFERAHPGVEVAFNFAGTQELRTQLEQGAPADIFASADQRHMHELRRAARVLDPAVFARNEPVIVVTVERSAAIRGLADLPAANRLVVGLPEVPIGRYTLQIFEAASRSLGGDFTARVEARIVSRELNVRQVLAKVSLGEADAGIVYRTDAVAARGGVSIVTIPAELNAIAEYPIAVVSGSPHPDLARAWVQLVLSDSGRRALRRAGFIAPSTSADTP